MNGAMHYFLAEDLTAWADRDFDNPELTTAEQWRAARLHLGMAQVHATLALAAATMSSADPAAWGEVG